MYNRMPVYIQTHMRNGLAIMSFLPMREVMNSLPDICGLWIHLCKSPKPVSMKIGWRRGILIINGITAVVESSKIGASNAEYTVKANGISNLCRIAERESFPRSIPILRYYHVQEHTLYCDFYRCLLSHLQAEKFTVSFYAAISCFKLIPGKLLRQLNPEFVCSLSF